MGKYFIMVVGFIEQFWVKWLERLGPLWFSTIGTFIIHETVYFGTHLFFMIADFIPALKKYKLQPKYENTGKRQWACFISVLFNHLCIQLPMMLAVEPMFGGGRLRIDPPFTNIYRIVGVCVAGLILEDFYFYWIHRFLHWGPLYKHIHKLHHDYSAPFGMAAEYAHPIETFFLGFGTMLGPILFASHLSEVWIWLCVRLLQTVEVHSGYDFPWSLNNIIPFWGGAIFHDYHHETFTGNFASTFIVGGAVFATDTKYRDRLRKRQ